VEFVEEVHEDLACLKVWSISELFGNLLMLFEMIINLGSVFLISLDVRNRNAINRMNGVGRRRRGQKRIQ
jgi:hypothetical protein